MISPGVIALLIITGHETQEIGRRLVPVAVPP
jgi:hypothetical protein